MTSTHKRIFSFVFMFAFSTAMFFHYAGINVLDFKRVGWLMIGDPGQSWSGWNFFRNTPLLQWPLGLNYNYGMGVGGSIVYTDSIPLMAFIFKPFSELLPARFQYHGLWMYLCFLMQSVCAFLVLRKLSKDEVFSAIAACFFCIAPIFLNRAGGHFALGAQWLIMAGFYLYLNKSFCFKRWALILAVTTMVHAYLLVMVYFVFIFDIINRMKTGELRLKHVVACIPTYSVFIFFTMYATGYFVIKGSDPYPGFGYLNMDLAGWFNPGDQRYSHLLLSHGQQQSNYEGINFLGAGIILLLVFMAIDAVFNKKIAFKNILTAPAFYFCLFMAAISITYRINVYGINLVEIPMNDFLLKVGSIFRSSGRFFWPVTMVMMLIVLLYLRNASSKAALILIPALVLTVLDEGEFFKAVRGVYSDRPYSSQMLGAEWEQVTKGKDTLIAMDYDDFSLHSWLPFAELASSEKMKMNFGYFARADKSAIETNKRYIQDIIKDGKLKQNEIYISKDQNWLGAAQSRYGQALHIKKIDEYYAAWL